MISKNTFAAIHMCADHSHCIVDSAFLLEDWKYKIK